MRLTMEQFATCAGYRAVGSDWPRRQNMDCCGHGHMLTRRRWICSTLTSVAAIVGGD